MLIQNNCAVSLDFVIKDKDGNIIDSSQEELMHYLHGRGQLPPKLEVELLGKSCGQQVKMELSAKDAYGEHRADLVSQLGPEDFEEGLHIYEGMIFQRETENGPQFIRVTKIDNNVITADANHPLAGMCLTFDVVVMAVRAATPDEMRSGIALAEAPSRRCRTRNKSCDHKH